MKRIYSILMILAAAAGFTNCSKAELVENKETEKGGSVVYATTDAATKTTLAVDYKVLWSTGDQIKFVKDGATTTTYTFTLSSGEGTTNGTFTYSQTPEDGTYTVYYPATYDGTSWHAQTYAGATDISGAPMKATATVSGGSVSDISFKNEGGILRYTVKGSKTIKSINVKSGSTLDVTLSCGTSGVALTAEGTVFNIALPAGEYSNATLAFTATDNTVATKTASTFTVTKNKVSLATFEATALSFLPDGALPGLFTVGKGADGEAGTADDLQVRFSKSNLVAEIEANGALKAWKFATNQYDYIGGTVANTSIGNTSTSGTEGDVDLFGWSTSTNGGSSTTDNYGINTSNSPGVYSGEFYDWGKAVGDGNTWRTLSTEEWQYLFDTRAASTVSGEENARYAKATVNDKAGIILLPDTYEHPTGVTALTSINTKNAAFTANIYDLTVWKKMEDAGAVFLPAAGLRDGSYVGDVGVRGNYWSSTKSGNSKAYGVNFSSSSVYPDNFDYRRFGYSVRLITESN